MRNIMLEIKNNKLDEIKGRLDITEKRSMNIKTDNKNCLK